MLFQKHQNEKGRRVSQLGQKEKEKILLKERIGTLMLVRFSFSSFPLLRKTHSWLPLGEEQTGGKEAGEEKEGFSSPLLSPPPFSRLRRKGALLLGLGIPVCTVPKKTLPRSVIAEV